MLANKVSGEISVARDIANLNNIVFAIVGQGVADKGVACASRFARDFGCDIIDNIRKVINRASLFLVNGDVILVSRPNCVKGNFRVALSASCKVECVGLSADKVKSSFGDIADGCNIRSNLTCCAVYLCGPAS